jgi:inositol-1,4,5-trisphosphate 5-phosphatase
MSAFGDQLFEYEKTFPPRFEIKNHSDFLFFVFSYPYSEEHDEARSYLRARCPAWCDRILLSHSFNNLVDTEVSKL